MKRTLIADVPKKKQVCLQGWCHDLRDLSKVKFILLRDSSGVVQCVVKAESKAAKNFSELTAESVISIEGSVKAASVKSPEVSINDFEVDVEFLTLMNKSEALPIQVYEKDKTIQTDISVRLDNRSLDLRKKKIRAIFKIQSEISMSFREYFKKEDFLEIQCPSIIASASEGGTELFPVSYFEKKAYLAQSPQLYKQLCAISLERVFTITPVWRAEKHNTIRHLNESRQMDIEAAFHDDIQVMKHLEKAVQFIVESVLKNCKHELAVLGLSLNVPRAEYLTYDETLKVLAKHGIKLKNGDDLSPESEKKLCELYPESIVFVHSWPLSLKPFYILPKSLSKTEKMSKGFDALYGGIEISSGGQRVHLPEVLIKQLKEKGLNPGNFKFYVDSFRVGAPEHSGWSIGLERFTMALLKLDNIREACLFPRDRDRLTP